MNKLEIEERRFALEERRCRLAIEELKASRQLAVEETNALIAEQNARVAEQIALVQNKANRMAFLVNVRDNMQLFGLDKDPRFQNQLADELRNGVSSTYHRNTCGNRCCVGSTDDHW